LATALFGAGEREAAVDELLTLFKRDREWNEQQRASSWSSSLRRWGERDPLTLSARRRLSSLMFILTANERDTEAGAAARPRFCRSSR